MKKKTLWTVGILGLVFVLALGILWFLKVLNRRNDPNWQLAEQIYKVENALKEVDEGYECQCISKVTPFSYSDTEGNTITYYCCQTTYVSGEYREYTGMNTDAISMVIDFAQIKNRRECKVDKYDAFQCEIDDRTYLCWTISPKFSCVIEYSTAAVEEADIFRMAESVLPPAG